MTILPCCKKIGRLEKVKMGKLRTSLSDWELGHAPTESDLQQGDDFAEQPFGIQVCQAKVESLVERAEMLLNMSKGEKKKKEKWRIHYWKQI